MTAKRRKRKKQGRQTATAKPGAHQADPSAKATPAADAGGSALTDWVGRYYLFIALGLAFLHLGLAAATFITTPHTGGDSAAYIALGRSLLDRHAYLSVWDPAAPLHTQYPPVFPGIIALAMLAGLGTWVRLKMIVTAFSAVAVAFSFLWVHRRGRPMLALGVGALLAISPAALTESHWVLSDVPFWAFTAVALFAFERLEPKARLRLAIAVGATVLAYFTRSAGLPLALAAFAWLAIERRFRQLAALAIVLVPLAFLWWLRARTGGGVDYVEQFWFIDPYTPALGRIGIADLFTRIGDNGYRYLTVHLPILLTGAPTPGAVAVSGVAAVLALAGWTRALVKRWGGSDERIGIAELFLPLYLGLLLVWPAVWSGERFLLPAMPVLLLYAGAGLAWLAGRVARSGPLWAGAAAVLLISALAAPRINAAVELSSACMAEDAAGEPYPCLAPAWHDFFTLAVISRDALPDGSTVISRKPRLFYELSGWPGRIYPLTEDRNAFFEEVDDSGARYVVLDRLGQLAELYLGPILMERTEEFCVLYARPVTGTAMLGIRSEPDTAAVGTDAFPFCGPEYWRDQATQDRVLRDMAEGR